MRTTPPLLPRLLAGLLLGLGAAACDSTRIGDPCEFSFECTPGQSCYAGADGGTFLGTGFCSKACEEAGTPSSCPGGSICAQSGEVLACILTCQTDADCREGFSCVAVGSGKGCLF